MAHGESPSPAARPSGNGKNLSQAQRKMPPQNVVQRLIKRETHVCPPATHFHVARSFHQNFFPNFTVVNVDKPPCFLRKFSNDGRHIVAFSADQTSIEIYEYLGPAMAENILQKAKGEYTANSTDHESMAIRSNIFERFFRQKHVVMVASNGEQLNRECSLFTDDGRCVIVGSASYIPDDTPPPFHDIYQNNESVSPNPRMPLEDYSLHVVDLVAGKLCDTRTFKVDKIFMSHNQGLYLYGNTLAVLSVQHQTIHIFQVTSEGTLESMRTIGRFCHDDDELVVALAGVHPRTGHPPSFRQFRDVSINALKHRVLVYLYRNYTAQQLPEERHSIGALRRFYQYFDQFQQLRMWKMQLLDEDHLLIKYASEDVVTLRILDPSAQPAFFVVYNMTTTQVLAIYENTSRELLDLFENFCDLFRNSSLHLDTQFPCSTSSNNDARLIQERYKQTIVTAKFGGRTEAVKRLLTQLPISSQSYSTSPYLDLSLFSYDEKWVSLLERPKNCGERPIRFYTRNSGLLKFKIHAGVLGNHPPPAARRLVAFTFHPYDPFAISVQRTNTDYVVNFHIRHNPV